MAIKEYHVKPTDRQIKVYIDSEELQEYIVGIKQYLNIQNVETNLLLCKNDNSIGSLATIGTIKDFCETNNIFINSRRIAEKCSVTFELLINEYEVYTQIVKVYVRLALVHELIHVKQIKNGCLTEELVRKESEKTYEDKSYEKEAIHCSKSIIGKSNGFFREVIEYIDGGQVNQEVKEKLLQEYNRI
ncbi:hypothetical protein [Niallia sp. NCCP-28]|uniref:hypothetical protein n=1 Tax=Niallia sp. NCCP-28 TaxID=2934712 RepID=UPI0020828877|nr:hypothetical protein [Niallia sp. NCCP-28]GKU83395.1 hypothetical protein NCCP28_27910 [Niallia sp. NCCP-28]